MSDPQVKFNAKTIYKLDIIITVLLVGAFVSAMFSVAITKRDMHKQIASHEAMIVDLQTQIDELKATSLDSEASEPEAMSTEVIPYEIRPGHRRGGSLVWGK